MRRLLIFCSFVFLAAAYCLYFKAAHERAYLWMDELLTYYQVHDKALPQIFSSLGSGMNKIPPLYFIVIWLEQCFTQLTPFILRFPSLLFAIIAIIPSYGIARKFLDRIGSLTAVFTFYLFNLMLARYSFEARPYTMFFCAAAFAFYSAICLFEQKQPSKALWSANACVSFLLPMVHYAGLIYSVFAALAFVITDLLLGRKLRVNALLSFVAGWLLFSLLCLRLLSAQGGSGLSMAWVPEVDAGYCSYIISQLIPVPWIFVLFWVTLYILEFYRVSRNDIGKSHRLSLSNHGVFAVVNAAVWLAIVILTFVLSKISRINVFVPRYFIPVSLSGLVFLCLMLTCFFPRVVDRVANRPNRSVVVIIVVYFAAIIFGWFCRIGGLNTMIKPDISPQGYAGRYFPGLARSGYASYPRIINEAGVFLESYYYSRPDERIYLLRKDRLDRQSIVDFNKDLANSTLIYNDLPAIRKFIYIQGLKYPGDKDALPDFDIAAWADQHNYALSRVSDIKVAAASLNTVFPIVKGAVFFLRDKSNE